MTKNKDVSIPLGIVFLLALPSLCVVAITIYALVEYYCPDFVLWLNMPLP